ncbi:hypothetical protein [Aquicella lusitana]|uniref:Uncharacterized protein n=1 Tax=Aquicella lusitana TaxID=254246 RepID=A0A370G5G6_9COXI|nr:hypothetical protein [Aquicella lusitana]RDI39058.1 hypothetical protein C8D86_12914 [Aquicella lusitana]VVC73665.1 hypothetical protein AQULUS_14120 [Aquicella lusitana]
MKKLFIFGMMISPFILIGCSASIGTPPSSTTTTYTTPAPAVSTTTYTTTPVTRTTVTKTNY